MAKVPKLAPQTIRAFRAQIWAFYGQSGRKLPWRSTRKPYEILVSELMLQQTQVSRVLEKYPEFLKKFPNVGALAKAPLSDVLRAWQGMGYNRRARYLKDAALMIIRDYRGKVPLDEQELRKLPGIGHYTANAILTFARNEPRVFIETNIRRVYIHHFFPKSTDVPDSKIIPVLDATLDKSNPREWYYALMDYGSVLLRTIRKNSNTQSKHYHKQTIFKGSLRELRGKIVRLLSAAPQTLQSLKNACENDTRTNETLVALKKDRLIRYENKKYKLA